MADEQAKEFPAVDHIGEHFAGLIKSGDIIKCKPWGKDQGDFVLVNASDFDPEIHERFDSVAKPVVSRTRKGAE